MSDKPPVLFPVHERFYTWQGEGDHMGRAAFFIRLFGCPVHCPWCDSAGTWHKNWVPKEIDRMSPEQLWQEAAETRAPIVVITGGEPAVHDLKPLTLYLMIHEGTCSPVDIHLETSGAFPIKGDFDWITLSPKKWKLPLTENIQQADEFKIIVESPDDIPFYLKIIRGVVEGSGKSVWLHPEWSQRANRRVLEAISSTIKENPRSGINFRAGYQLHKLYLVDTQDSRSRKTVPLGGDLDKGY